MAHASLRGILYSCEESHFRRNDLENTDDKNFQISLKNDNYYKEVNVYLWDLFLFSYMLYTQVWFWFQPKLGAFDTIVQLLAFFLF